MKIMLGWGRKWVVAALLLPLVMYAWVLPVWAADMELEGEAVQGGLMIGRVKAGAKVWVDGRRVRVSKEGVFLVGFNRDEVGPMKIRATLPGGGDVERELSVRRRTYKEQHIDGLPPDKVTPTAEDYVRIRKENALVGVARTIDAPRTEFLQGFKWPLIGPVSGIYGSRRILNGNPRRPHFGVDIVAPVGTKVRAPAGGEITLVHPDMFFSGGTLMLDHGHGLSSTFLHLHRILVRKGQLVKRGDIIAEVGATGRVTGAHLDWRINLFKRRLDPARVVEPMPSAQ